MLVFFKKNSDSSRPAPRSSAGFTILELMTVIVIFSIMASIVLARFSTFTDNVSLENLAQQIALQIKQAQSSAISGAYPHITSAQIIPLNWRPSYGVYFAINNPAQFTYFFDSETDPGDVNSPTYKNVFDDATSATACGAQYSECLNTIMITTGERILDICNDTTCGLPRVALTFTRQFPDRIATDNILNITGPGIYAGNIKIKIGKDANSPPWQYITVTPLGQISVSST